VLNRLPRYDPSDIRMVGDRRHDVEGAREHGIATIAVRWGYAVPGELEAAAPLAICADAAELASQLELGIDAAAS
jgi:phosphoglycolate phosphatase